METTIKINLPEDFRLLCEIFQYEPGAVLQAFVDKVSFPVYYRNPADPHPEATEFFLDYIMHLGPEPDQSWTLHDSYLSKMGEAVKAAADEDEREAVCRKMIGQWHQAVKDYLKGPKRNGKESDNVKL